MDSALLLSPAQRLAHVAYRCLCRVASSKRASVQFAQGCLLAGFAPELALQHFATATEQRPEWLAAQRRLARLQVQLGMANEAIATIGQILVKDPHSGPDHLLAAIAHSRLENPSAAEAHFRQALEISYSAFAVIGLCRILRLAGRLDEAAAAMASLRASDANTVAARVEQALLLRSHGRTDEALAKLESIAESNCGDWQAQFECANELGKHGHLDRSKALVRHSITLAPNHGKPWALLGQLSLAADEVELACGYFERACALDPLLTEAHVGLANAYSFAGRVNEAIATLQALLSRRPSHRPTLIALLDLLADNWRNEQGANYCEDYLDQTPDDLEALALVIKGLLQYQKFSRAEELARKYVQTAPESPTALTLLASSLSGQLRYQEAELVSRQVIHLAPEDPAPLAALAQNLAMQDRYEAARSAIDTALRLDDRCIDAWITLATIARSQRKLDEAAACYRRVQELSPGAPGPEIGLALIAFSQYRFGEALAHESRARQLSPRNATAHMNSALTHLTVGNFAEGWQEYQWRFRQRERRDNLAAPKPGDPSRVLAGDILPVDLCGKRFVVSREQGLGDELFFLRFLPRLRAAGAWTAYVGDDRLAGMLGRANVADQILPWARKDSLPNTDYILAVGDLPLVTGMISSADAPPPLPLRASEDKRRHVDDLLTTRGLGQGKPIVGLTWRAGAAEKIHQTQLDKRCPLTDLINALRYVDADFVVLQRFPSDEEIAQLEEGLCRHVTDLSMLNTDLEGMLALLERLDDYVGVSNTNMHLRASVGRPARVLIPSPPEFRWMAKGNSVWFPNFRLYREEPESGWTNALAALAKDLVDGDVPAQQPVYSRAQPSPRYQELLASYQRLHDEGEAMLGLPAEDTFPGISLLPQASRIKALIDATGAKTILDYGSGKGDQYRATDVTLPPDGNQWPDIRTYWGVNEIRCFDPGYAPYSVLPVERSDGVISTDVLEHCPEEDVPWIIDEIFSRAARFVFANIACYPAKKHLPTGENAHLTIRRPDWWQQIIEATAARYPGIKWEFWIEYPDAPGKKELLERRLSNF